MHLPTAGAVSLVGVAATSGQTQAPFHHPLPVLLHIHRFFTGDIGCLYGKYFSLGGSVQCHKWLSLAPSTLDFRGPLRPM